MISNSARTDRQSKIRSLFEEYIEMYAGRDDRLTTRFSDNFSGYSGGGDFLVRDRAEWVRITRQDFAQVPGRIRIEMLDLELQEITDDVVVATAFFHIHLPVTNPILAGEVARLVLIFRLEGDDWKIVHSGISIPYPTTQDGEVYPIRDLRERNSALEALVESRAQALHASESLHRLLTEDSLDVHWKTDSRLLITYISPADERLRGYRADQVLGHHVFEMFTDEGIATVKKMMKQRHEQEQQGIQVGFLTFVVQHRCADGRLVWGEVLSKPDRNAQGEIVGYHGITREITERKLLEEQVHQLAFYDPLTHLANRRLLHDRLEQSLVASRRSGCYGALLFLDLDNFKPLNDQHGHVAGDLLLIEVANRLKCCVRALDTVARFGGDEFVVMLGELHVNQTQSIEQTRAVAEKIRLSLSASYLLTVAHEGSTPRVVEHLCSASIGVVVFNGSGASQSDDLLKHADAAMYQAKTAGRNSIRFYAAPPPPE